MADRLRLGIVGAGAIAQVGHLPALRKIRDVEVAGICDNDVVKARALADRFDIPDVFHDLSELIEFGQLDALARRFGDTAVASASRPSRLGHARVDLGALVRVDLLRAGIATTALGTLSLGGERACTRCAPALFHSYRRDGAAAGRLVHFVRASPGRG